MAFRKRILRIVGVSVLLQLTSSVCPGQTPEPATSASKNSPSVRSDSSSQPTGLPFTREEKGLLAAKLLMAPATRPRSHPEQKVALSRSKVLSVTLPAETETLSTGKARRIAQVVVFDYAQGKASALRVDAASAEVLGRQAIRGRPQASEEEKREALEIIRQNQELNGLFQAGAAFEGGFIVDGPPGAPLKHRFLQVQLLSPDRLHLQRSVTVDLTAGTIAKSVRAE